METKHTKGEWKIFPIKASHAIQIINNEQQCIATANNYNGSARQMEANSKLIAAAPELLEALILMADYYIHDKSIDDGDYIDMENKVINAINKATK